VWLNQLGISILPCLCHLFKEQIQQATDAEAGVKGYFSPLDYSELCNELEKSLGSKVSSQIVGG
jgi:hypothetical protein